MNDQAVTLVWMAGVMALMLGFGVIALVGYIRRGRSDPPAIRPAEQGGAPPL